MAYKGIDKVDDFFMHYGRKGMKRGMNIYNPDYKPVGEKAKGPLDFKGITQREWLARNKGANKLDIQEENAKEMIKKIAPVKGSSSFSNLLDKKKIVDEAAITAQKKKENEAKEKAFQSSLKSNSRREQLLEAERNRYSFANKKEEHAKSGISPKSESVDNDPTKAWADKMLSDFKKETASINASDSNGYVGAQHKFQAAKKVEDAFANLTLASDYLKTAEAEDKEAASSGYEKAYIRALSELAAYYSKYGMSKKGLG